MKVLSIAGRKVGPGFPAYIIAEMSANHGHSYEEAVALVRAAKECGADAIKLQTYTADTITLKSDKPCFQIGKGTLWEGKNLYQLYEEAYTPWEWQPRLKREAESLGLHLFSTPFDDTAVDFLEKMEVPAHKIASFELVDLALLRRVAQTGKPMIVSTGMATVEEIEEAVRTIRDAGGKELALLKCCSAYPSPTDSMHLRAIQRLAKQFDVPVGLSDHTLDPVVPVTAVALGACIIEKHFILSRSKGGPDSAFSLEPDEFKAMVTAIRTAEKAMGGDSLEPDPLEAPSRMFRRSLFVAKTVKAGETASMENIRSVRPANGLPPRDLPQVLGRKFKRDVEMGTPLAWEDLEPTV